MFGRAAKGALKGDEAGGVGVPYFVRIGAIKSNQSGVGARGYHLFRRGRTIVTRWGAVVVLPGRVFRWIWRREKRFSMRSEAAARASYQRLVKERSATYDRLPPGVSIMPCAERRTRQPKVDERWYRKDVPALPWWPEAITAEHPPSVSGGVAPGAADALQRLGADSEP